MPGVRDAVWDTKAFRLGLDIFNGRDGPCRAGGQDERSDTELDYTVHVGILVDWRGKSLHGSIKIN